MAAYTFHIVASSRLLSWPRTPVKYAASAVDERNISLHRQIQNEAKRLGFNYVIGQRVDPIQLDQAIAGRDIGGRLRLKSMMAQAGVLR
jgi:hypothetical protein